MIHTDEDDEFERIARENNFKGQPYHYEPVYVSTSQRNQVLEEAAKVFDERDTGDGFYEPHEPAEIIRGMKK
jgi:uncharacterized protein (DUF952 family)